MLFHKNHHMTTNSDREKANENDTIKKKVENGEN